MKPVISIQSASKKHEESNMTQEQQIRESGGKINEKVTAMTFFFKHGQLCVKTGI
jgi:hypothetical protein